MTGSFNLIDVGERSERVKIKPSQQLFTAIALATAVVQELLKQYIDTTNATVRCATLHVAIAVGTSDTAARLIDAGARTTARLVESRALLYLTVIHYQPTNFAKLL